ncbi:alpha/beta fold hydrolase, partial [Thermodesulfobacteriota bacterium]
MLPFKSNFIKIDGLKYHYVDENPGNKNKKTIIFLHGNPTWSYYYKNLTLALREGYRVIVPDHIGCGLSDKPQDYDYTLQNHVENLEKLVQHLDI